MTTQYWKLNLSTLGNRKRPAATFMWCYNGRWMSTAGVPAGDPWGHKLCTEKWFSRIQMISRCIHRGQWYLILSKSYPGQGSRDDHVESVLWHSYVTSAVDQFGKYVSKYCIREAIISYKREKYSNPFGTSTFRFTWSVLLRLRGWSSIIYNIKFCLTKQPWWLPLSPMFRLNIRISWWGYLNKKLIWILLEFKSPHITSSESSIFAPITLPLFQSEASIRSPASRDGDELMHFHAAWSSIVGIPPIETF